MGKLGWYKTQWMIVYSALRSTKIQVYLAITGWLLKSVQSTTLLKCPICKSLCLSLSNAQILNWLKNGPLHLPGIPTSTMSRILRACRYTNHALCHTPIWATNSTTKLARLLTGSQWTLIRLNIWWLYQRQNIWITSIKQSLWLSKQLTKVILIESMTSQHLVSPSTDKLLSPRNASNPSCKTMTLHWIPWLLSSCQV